MTQTYHSKNIKFYVPLNKKEILERVSPFYIFKHYYGKDIDLGVSYESPFRKDKNPSFAFHTDRTKECKFTDFATGENGDCFDFVMKMYNCTFMEGLRLVNQDFNLGLGNELKVSLKRATETPGSIRKKPLIQITTQKYTEADLKYWSQFGITEEMLKQFNIYSVHRCWINKKLIGIYKDSDPIFAYYFPESKHLKIYRPLTKNKMNKWLGNSDMHDIQGSNQLNLAADTIVLTSSLKDVIVLHLLGYQAIALNSEGARPSTKLLEILSSYKNKFILYDNDEAGIKYSRTMMDLIEDLKLLEILDENSKDPSDFVALHGLDKLDRMLKSQYDS